jgi:uncharacterized membrane protein
VGKDPARGTIIPQYGPPDDLSPAAVRYITRLAYDHKTFAAALIDMAVKGYLSIHEANGDYTLVKGEADQSVLTKDEKQIAGRLELELVKKLALKNQNHSKIGNALTALKKSLAASYEKRYFIKNSGYFIAGLVLSCIGVIVTGLSGTISEKFGFLFMAVWLSGWTAGVIFLLFQVIKAWKEVFIAGRVHGGALIQAVFLSCFAIPFVAGELFGIFALSTFTSPWLVVVLIGTGGINFLFYHLLKAPTGLGRETLDKIEGFRMYLSVAEKDRLNLLIPPEQTPETFEKFLPYALALNVEQHWAEQFSSVLKGATEVESGYSPVWYSGTGWRQMNMSGFTASLGTSLSSAVSSSSTAPRSSSGFSSGGSSGGGGGGGGGGGW